MSHTFKAPVSVWISQYSLHDADSLQQTTSMEGMTIGDVDENLSGLKYTKVGFGTVEITIASKDEIIAGKVEALRAELQKDRADSQARQNALMRKISELEALTYSGAA